ncbi:hypothetical protein ACIRLA_28905 [Streptomyces sp. NPDC102364]|uniref:hypothetical protein n=1 Tax=Streptomyces sp. NPDC102364 TaxID=3366161 RepID=UPI00381760F7
MDESGASSSYEGWHLSSDARALTRRALNGHLLQGDEPGAEELIERGVLVYEPWYRKYAAANMRQLQRRVHAEQRARVSDLLHEQTTADRFFDDMARIEQEQVPGLRYSETGSETQGALQAALADATTIIRTAQPVTRTAETLKLSLSVDIPRLERGISLKTIYPDSARSRGPEQNYVKTVSEHGAEVRTLAGDFIRCIIVDDTLAVISDYRTLPADRNTAWVVTHPGILAFVTQVFESQWGVAAPWMGGRARSVDGGTITTARTREILRRFSREQTIKQIASGMGLSVATINAEISSLYEQTGTGSHFALGAWWARSEEQKLL